MNLKVWRPTALNVIINCTISNSFIELSIMQHKKHDFLKTVKDSFVFWIKYYYTINIHYIYISCKLKWNRHFPFSNTHTKNFFFILLLNCHKTINSNQLFLKHDFGEQDMNTFAIEHEFVYDRKWIYIYIVSERERVKEFILIVILIWWAPLLSF